MRGLLGTGKGVRDAEGGKTHPGETSEEDEKGRHAAGQRTFPPGQEHADGDVHPECLFTKRGGDPLHQRQL